MKEIKSCGHLSFGTEKLVFASTGKLPGSPKEATILTQLSYHLALFPLPLPPFFGVYSG
jgi:hypothetical protein